MLKEQTEGVDKAWRRVLTVLRTHPWGVIIGAMSVAALTFIVFWSNGPHPYSVKTGANNGSATAASSATSPATPSAMGGVTDQQASAPASTPPKSAMPTRKVIEQASLSISLPHVEAVANQLDSMANKAGGFVELMAWSDGKDHSNVQMTIRIPEPQFTSFLNSVRSLGTVTNFSQTGQDVTDESNNLEQSIAELNGQVEAYTRLYNKSQSMQDMLQIQQALSNANSQVSNLTSQLHDLNRSVQLATVNMNLTANSPEVAARPTNLAVANAITQSVHVLLKSLLGLVIFLLWILPWGILIGVGIWIWCFISLRKHGRP